MHATLNSCTLNGKTLDTITDADLAGLPLNAGVMTLRANSKPAAIASCAYPQCTAIYRVYLHKNYTTQCNDYGMLVPDGIDQTPCSSVPFYSSARLVNGVGEPFKDDQVKQAAALALSSVTALTEPTGQPIGFHSDVLLEYYGVCVQVFGVSDHQVPNRWVEIMAESKEPQRSFCVTDFDKPLLRENIVEESCGQGDLYACRSANVLFKEPMKIMFYCKENCDVLEFGFYWRIVASRQPSSSDPMMDKSDNEDWCQTRYGSDFPSSLIPPYPQNYVQPAIFQTSTSSASSVTRAFPYWVFAFLVVVVVFFF